MAERRIWSEYRNIIGRYDKRGERCVATVTKEEFYEKIRNCYAVIASGEKALYGNIVLKKGLILD